MYRPNQIVGARPSPLQTVSGYYYPAQSSSTSWTNTLTSLMPWVVVIVAIALFAPMLKGAFSGNK